MRRMTDKGPATSVGSLRPAFTARCLKTAERFGVVDRIESLPSINLSLTVWSEIARLTARGEEADRGFAGRNDYEEILDVLRSGNAFPMARPLLMISDDDGENLEAPCEVILRDRDGKNIALMHLTEKFKIDIESLKLFSALNEELAALIREYILFGCDLAIAGDIEVVNVEKATLSSPPVARESGQAGKRSRG